MDERRSEAVVVRAGAHLEMRILDPVHRLAARAGRELRERARLDPGRRKHVAVAPHDARDLRDQVAEAGEARRVFGRALDLGDPVECPWEIHRQRDAVERGPREIQVEPLALVALLAGRLRFGPLFRGLLPGQHPAGLLPRLRLEVDRDVASRLARRALGRVDRVARQAYRAGRCAVRRNEKTERERGARDEHSNRSRHEILCAVA